MDIYKIYYLFNPESPPSVSSLPSSLESHTKSGKNAAKLLLLAKRVWKIKLAFSNMPNAFTSFASSFSSGFSFYDSLFFSSIRFFILPYSMRYDAMRWMPHSNSSLFVYPSQKLNYMKVLQDVYTAPAGMTIVRCRHLLSTIGWLWRWRKFYDVSALAIQTFQILSLNYFCLPRRKVMRFSFLIRNEFESFSRAI